jgi:hypothetical protein
LFFQRELLVAGESRRVAPRQFFHRNGKHLVSRLDKHQQMESCKSKQEQGVCAEQTLTGKTRK